MAELTAQAADRTDASPLAPVRPAIDRAHLALMTLGERSLEREVLSLFDRQAVMLLARMQNAEPASAAAFAHTLKGSARGIGAWRVAEAAHALATHANRSERREMASALRRLSMAVTEARAGIADIQRADVAAA